MGSDCPGRRRPRLRFSVPFQAFCWLGVDKRSEVSRKRIFAGRELFSSFLPPLVGDLDMFGMELSLGDREDFSRGKPGCSVAAVWRKTDLSLCA